MAKGGAGRPSDYQDDHCRIAKSMCKLGATDREVAEALGVTEQTLNTWKHKHPKFLKALRVGKRAADDRVESSLYRRAIGYSYDAEKIFQYEGEAVRVPYVEHVPPDPGAAMNWLKNRRAAKWKEVKATEVYTPPGQALLVASDREDLLSEYYRRQRLAAEVATRASGEGVEPDRQEPDPPPGDPAAGEG